MLNEFRKFITENNLIKPGDKILLAVSGGIDSMVMTHLFLLAGYKVAIAHCNFSLRAGESDMDEELVRKYAEEKNIPFFSTTFQTKAFAKKNGISIQMAARELRYSWFEEIRTKNSFDSVAVAHNLNDNIETLLINLTRGTGITGLTGMKPISNRLIRPLLFASRNDIIIFCREQGLIYREDKSNSDTKYTRNKIRHKIIPVLKEINPSIESTLSETAERFSAINEIISDYILEVRNKVSEVNDEGTIFNIGRLKNYLNNKAIVFELFKPFGLNNVQITDLLKITGGNTGGHIFTPTHRIIKNRKELIVQAINYEQEFLIIAENIDELLHVPGIKSADYADITTTFELPTDPHTACFDSDRISFPITIRKWRPGDYFYPLGMKQKKKLSDYFIDKKYSKIDKEKILILESAGKIAWIIGDRIDNGFRVTESTKRLFIIRSGS
jgi:tRNA(Ile)-lysidine synthase